LTVGQDCMLGVWDIKTQRQTRYAKLECGANVVEYSEDGKKIAIGMLNGYLLVVQSDDWAPVAKTQHSMNGQAITAIRFSPDNRTCAVGGQDGRIKVYDVESSFRKA
jgi:WD40 repeat protein